MPSAPPRRRRYRRREPRRRRQAPSGTPPRTPRSAPTGVRPPWDRKRQGRGRHTGRQVHSARHRCAPPARRSCCLRPGPPGCPSAGFRPWTRLRCWSPQSCSWNRPARSPPSPRCRAPAPRGWNDATGIHRTTGWRPATAPTVPPSPGHGRVRRGPARIHTRARRRNLPPGRPSRSAPLSFQRRVRNARSPGGRTQGPRRPVQAGARHCHRIPANQSAGVFAQHLHPHAVFRRYRGGRHLRATAPLWARTTGAVPRVTRLDMRVLDGEQSRGNVPAVKKMQLQAVVSPHKHFASVGHFREWAACRPAPD